MLKRNVFLTLASLLLVAFFVLYALVHTAAPVQGSAPATPQATRDPIKQATRRATRGLPPRVPATTTPMPTLGIPEDTNSADAAPVNPGPMTSSILVFNPDTSGAATIQLDIYNSAGAVVNTITDTVAADGAKLFTLPGSLGSNFQGGAQVSSDKNVQAIVLGANSTNTARDAYEGIISPALDVTLPFVRHLAQNTQNSIIAVQNTTGNDGSMTLKLYGLDGSPVVTQTLSIVAHQSRYFNTNSLFPVSTFIGSARVVADQNIAVAAQTLYYNDTAALGGIPTDAGAGALWLNQAERKFNNGGAAVNWSEIFVRNNGTNPTDITLNFLSAAGSSVLSTTVTGTAPNGMAPFLLNDPAFAALGTDFSGWVKISSAGEPLTATALEAFNKGKRLYGFNALRDADMGTRYVCGDAARMGTENSQFTILNTDASANAVVLIRLYDQTTGAKIAQGKIKVLPQSRTTISLSDTKFAAAGNNYQGMAVVQVNGTTPPKIAVTVNNPYLNPKLAGTNGYTCSKLQ